MPSKSSRAASRQAQIRKKRQRDKPRTQVFDSGPAESEGGAAAGGARAVVEETPVAAETAIETGVAAKQSRPAPAATVVPRRVGQAPVETALAYPQLAPEVRQIGMMAALIVVILVVLTVVLRS